MLYGGKFKDTGCVAYKYTCHCILNEMHGVNNAEVGGHLSRAADGTELREAAVSVLSSHVVRSASYSNKL